jgi:hypothetical protein
MQARTRPSKVLRAYIEQGDTTYHMHCRDDNGREWVTRCEDADTLGNAIKELRNCAFHWGYTDVQRTDEAGEQIEFCHLTAPPRRLQRLAEPRL